MLKNMCMIAAALAIIGCGEPAKKTTAKPPVLSVKPELLKPLVWDDKPREVIPVTAAREKKEGETIHVVGVIPPSNVGPFNPAVATVILLDPADMTKDEVKTELECDDAATCPKCRKLLNALALYVELVDDKGKVIPSTLEGYSGVKPGSTVAFSGTVKRADKNGPMRFIATSFSARPRELD